ncbi:hypothetical protein CEUSTIGMA_g11814.t1 [Chlamydomonas eustigma]|uniref:ABC transporter domain-containing protein n=1 Tax=Chlamydomonas eustigma TaxID=1157962 RepID=A0A250XNA4_9CHLO|nr:hypothetical protein CEUSTIGMA_g11814.t1 [Chlamydomonas eustigma]|eukprot:GAX84392.1 hypothetical protein CEUSTIGMA_g11814.t1 [Chlamydomonas eustigma]
MQSSQFTSVVKKNFTLLTRGRRSLFGLGGWSALLLQVLLPGIFFLLMWIPRHYIKPSPRPQILPTSSIDLESRWWSGSNPYSGPAVATQGTGQAHILLAPGTNTDSAQMQIIAEILSKALACPRDLAMWSCPTPLLPNSFHCMFINKDLSEHCQDVNVCHNDPICYAHLLGIAGQISVMATADDAVRQAVDNPMKVDAVVILSAIKEQSSEQHDKIRWEYTIRMNHTDVPPTPLLLDLFDVSPTSKNGLGFYRDYWFFTNLQFAIDRSLLGLEVTSIQNDVHSFMGVQHQQPDALIGAMRSTLSSPSPLIFRLQVRPFPWPATVQDLGAASAAAFLNLLLVFAFLAPTRAAVSEVVREKELRLREGMRILGLNDLPYWLSWALTHWTTLMVSGLICTAMCAYPFPKTSSVLLAAFFGLLSAALISFSYFLSTLFPTARIAGTAAQLAYAMAVLPGFIIPTSAPYGGRSWWLACLLPPSAASMFGGALINWELISQGINMHTFSISSLASFWLPAISEFGKAGYQSILMLQIIGSAHTPRRPLWFPLQRSYWERGLQDSPTLQGYKRGGFNMVAGGGGLAVEISNLCKVYQGFQGGIGGSYSRLALDSVSLGIRRGRVTAVLGHNGAGKTTLISILTGTLEPSSGHASVAGLDVSRDMAVIRKTLGLCPQFDLLWPDLTAAEHLRLYANIKGMPSSLIDKAVEAAVDEVGLLPQLHVMAGDMSGGQRRKLSVAVALLGKPSVVFLDEPTNGMDPYSRRFTWEVIRSRRGASASSRSPSQIDLVVEEGTHQTCLPADGHSAIILTTHSMEEADALADDVVVMADGRIAASGTPLELKQRFGAGYTLSLTLSDVGRAQEGPSRHTLVQHSGSTVEALTALVKAHIPQAVLLQASVPTTSPGCDAGDHHTIPVGSTPAAHAYGEVSYRLPKEHASCFPDLLRELQQKGSSLGMLTYGITETTLEEVFHSITSQAHAISDELRHDDETHRAAKQGNLHELLWNGQQPSGLQDVQAPIAPPQLLQGWALLAQQFWALVSKRALIASRDRMAVLTQLFVPMLLVYLALWVQGLAVHPHAQAPLDLTRQSALRGASSVVGASEAVRGLQGGSTLEALLSSYPSVRDSGQVSLLESGGNLSTTLEGWMLDNWHSGHPAYDAVFVNSLPVINAQYEYGGGTGVQPQQQLPSRTVARMLEGVDLVIMINQTAVHALPTAMNQATSALMWYLHKLPAYYPLPPLSPTLQPPLPAAVTPAPSPGEDTPMALSYVLSQYDESFGDPKSSPQSIKVTSWPLPPLVTEPIVRVQQSAAALMLALCMTLASSVLTASFSVQLVRERSSGFQLLQALTGTPMWTFWIATLVWDVIQYTVPTAGIVLLMRWYDIPQYSGIRLEAVAVLLGGLGFAGLPATYLLQLPFQDEMVALQRLNTLFFMVGYLGYLTTWIFDLIVLLIRPPRLTIINNWVKRILLSISPHYCFASGVSAVAQTAPGSGLPPLPPFGPGGKAKGAFDWDVSGRPLMYMSIQGGVYFMLVLLLESSLLSAAWSWMCYKLAHSSNRSSTSLEGLSQSTQERERVDHESQETFSLTAPLMAGPESSISSAVEDVDVVAERNSIKAGHGRGCQVILDDLKKSYWPNGPFGKSVQAVKGISLGVAQGECFGLLGVNGAGKTSTFKILTGEENPDQGGRALVGGFDVVSNRSAARQAMGYCPQFEGLPAALTARELLSLYARLRGVPWRSASFLSSALSDKVGIPVRDKDRLCGSYSGGNRRKLAVAVALIGDPRVVLLDEPSTGMDPGARRQLWALIRSQALQQHQLSGALAVSSTDVPGLRRSVVLTSHIMEECEALCSRVGIMAKGTLRCIGTIQHLKSKFDSGYILTVQLKEESNPVQPNALSEAFLGFLVHLSPTSRILDHDGVNHFVIAIPRDSTDLPEIFEALEKSRQGLGLMAYSLSQATTLERVFVSLASSLGQ